MQSVQLPRRHEIHASGHLIHVLFVNSKPYTQFMQILMLRGSQLPLQPDRHFLHVPSIEDSVYPSLHIMHYSLLFELQCTQFYIQSATQYPDTSKLYPLLQIRHSVKLEGEHV